MSEQDLLDIIEYLRNLQIQQEQNIRQQQELTEELNHIPEGRGGDPTNPQQVGRVSPVLSGRASPIVGDRTQLSPQ